MREREFVQRALRGTAVLALSGAAFGAAGCSKFDSNPSLEDGPRTRATIPVDGSVDTIEEYMYEKCVEEDIKLSFDEVNRLVDASETLSDKDLSVVIPGETFLIPVVACDRVHQEG